MKNQNDNTSFSWFRRTFFPIHLNEIQKVIPFAIIFAGIVFTYTLCRQAKDFFIMGVGGANVIPSAKVLVLIAAAGLGILHSKITKKYSHYKAFLISFLPFIVFFVLFSVFFKYLHLVQMSPETIKILSTQIPVLRYFFVVIGNWVYCLNYIFSEMFGSFMLGATFWQLANFYSSHDEAKRFYPFYALFAQIGGFMAGFVFERIGRLVHETNDINYGVVLITGIIVFVAVIIVIAVSYFFKVTLQNPLYILDVQHHNHKKHKANKPKISWTESLKNLATNPTLILACLLAVWYGICATSLETFWKSKIGEFYGNGGGYMIFMGRYYQISSIATFTLTLLAAPLVRLLPWIVSALVTPIVVIFAAACLFGLGNPLFKDFFVKLIPINPIFVCVIVGAAVLIFFKAAKYVLFDSSKELFIRSKSEDQIIQVKSLETFTGRLGKGGSAIIQSAILAIPGMTMDTMSPILWIIVTVMGAVWIGSIVTINKEMVVFEKDDKKQAAEKQVK